MRDLTLFRDDAIDDVHFIVGKYYGSGNPTPSVEDVAKLCDGFLLLAVASLFADSNPQMFLTNLCRTAENWRRLLVHQRVNGLPVPAASRKVPFLAAVAAGDLPVAHAIATLSAREWRPEAEYESEFVYARLLYSLVSEDSTPGELIGLVERLDEVGSGAAWIPSRIEMSNALMAGDSDAFRSGFEAAHTLWEEEVEAKAASFTTPVTGFVPHRYLWLEGVALLRLARSRGVAPDVPYRSCPRLALREMAPRYQGDWVLPIGTE